MRSLFVFVFLIFSTVASAAKVAFVDIARIQAESKVTQNITEQIKEKQEELKQELKRVDVELQKKLKKFETSKSLLSDDALAKSQNDLRKEVEQTQKDLQSQAQKLEDSKNRALLKLNEKMIDIIEDVAKKHEYDVVSHAILYNNPEHQPTDITDDILTRLDKKIPKLKIDWNK